MNDFEKLLVALVAPAQDIENMFQQLISQRGINTAVGAQLDQLGKIVGAQRGGADDDTYRRLVRAQILTNQSCGQVRRLAMIVRLVINDPHATVVIHYERSATVIIRIGIDAITFAIASQLIVLLRAAKSAGVRLVLQFSESPVASTFKFDVGPGLDVGHLAGALE